jgi:hypothetical protein
MVRNFFETMMIKQANRLAMLNRISDEALNTIEYEDIEPLLHA